jgi:nucleotide-binding universal stress UspA family protein
MCEPSGLDDRLLQAATPVTRRWGRIALIHVEDISQFLPPRLIRSPQPRRVGAVTIDTISHRERNNVATATRLVKMGVPTDVLVASAAELKADLLVMGAVSRGDLGHIGTTAEAVIDGVTCDVLIVKPRQFKTTVPRKGPKLPT